MKNVFSRVAAIAALVVCAGAAQADVIDFEQPVDPVTTPFAPLLGEGDYFTQGDYYFQPFSNAAIVGSGDLVGSIINGSDLTSCFSVLCPINNTTTFYGAVNDSVMAFGRMDGLEFSVNSFDASYLGASGAPVPSVLGLQLQGILADGNSFSQGFLLGGPVDGNFNFDSFSTGAFGQKKFTSVLAFVFKCDDVSCTAFDANRGFALDNINVTAVPEPETYALMLVGLAALGAAARRRRAV